MFKDPQTAKDVAKLALISTQAAEKAMIEASRKNIVDFIIYMSDGEMIPAPHQLEWLYYLLSPQHKMVNIVAFRGSGKTRILVYTLAWLIGARPITTNAIFSSNADLARVRLREVRDMISSDARYHNVFPWISIDTKRTNSLKEFTVVSTRYGSNYDMPYHAWRNMVTKYGQPLNPTLFAAGITASGIAGRRFTGVCLLDDVHDIKNSATPQQRAKVVNNVQTTIMPCLWRPDDPKIVSINTRWADDDSPGVFKEQKRENGESVWVTTETPILDDNGEPTWKPMWTKETVQILREDEGEVVFQLMRMNNPKGASTGEFTLDMLRKPLPDDLPPLSELIISCDFADTEGLRSDYTVYTAMAKDKEKRFNTYVLDMVRVQRSKISDKVELLVTFVDKIFGLYGRLDAVLMEKRDSQPEAQGLQEKRMDIPVKIVPTKGDKWDRLKNFAHVVQAGRVYINHMMPTYNAMTSELTGFPGTHDDICDTLSLPYQTMTWATSLYSKVGKKTARSPYFL